MRNFTGQYADNGKETMARMDELLAYELNGGKKA